jgi:hypothetical protein
MAEREFEDASELFATRLTRFWLSRILSAMLVLGSRAVMAMMNDVCMVVGSK